MQRFTSNVFPNMSDGEGDETPKLTDAMVHKILGTIANKIPDANFKKVKIVLLELRDKLAAHINEAKQQPDNKITIQLEGDAEGKERDFLFFFTKTDYSFIISNGYQETVHNVQAISPWPNDIHLISGSYDDRECKLEFQLVFPAALQSPFVDLGIPL